MSEEEIKPGLQTVLCDMLVLAKVNVCVSPMADFKMKHRKDISPAGKTLVHFIVQLAWKERWPELRICIDLWATLNDLSRWSVLEDAILENCGQRNMAKRYIPGVLGMGLQCENTCDSVTSHPYHS